MVGRAHDWFNSRRWFIRVLLYAEWVILAIFAMTSAGVRLRIEAGESSKAWRNARVWAVCKK